MGKEAIVAAAISADDWQGDAGPSRRCFGHRNEARGAGDRAAELLPWVHTIFSNLETGPRGTHHGVSRSDPGCSLRELVYRFNRHRVEDRLIAPVLRSAHVAEPDPYAAMTAGRSG